MKKAPHLYPIGRQTFSDLIEEGLLYIDKTNFIYHMTHTDSKYVFLSRPRRFGKSLLVSTLRSYFEGRKELFSGLAIAQLESEWKKYPVLHFSMAGGKHMDAEQLNRYLSNRLAEWESFYGINANNSDANDRLTSLIQQVYKQTGEKVVVLIDEYDAPLLDVMHEDENLPKQRQIMQNFYSPLKDCDPYLRFVFLTGITKFSQLSIFSELNNIRNISTLDSYASICGITKDELLGQMNEDIAFLAEELGCSEEETIQRLQQKYDGYHFSKNSPDIFNPYSLLNCFADRELRNFWFSTGTPTYLIEMMRKFESLPSEIGSLIDATVSDFDAPTENLQNIIPLLYQSGYFTIKSYHREADIYTLGIPNEEVRTGLMHALVPNYIQTSQGSELLINKMAYCFIKDDIDGAFSIMQRFFKTVPYCNDIDHEGHWQQMLYVIFSIFGAKGDVEVHTSKGRVDLALVLRGTLYLMEIKLDKTAQEALQQINLKEYDKRFALLNLPIIKVGINFSTKERTITDWLVEK